MLLAAVNEDIDGLDATGRLAPSSAGLVAHYRALARAFDEAAQDGDRRAIRDLSSELRHVRDMLVPKDTSTEDDGNDIEAFIARVSDALK